ncbi:hypothetical protein PF007_g10223 [Phytophthora fragariae]|uniref:Secreted protein n=1 Tax=Phytophthora fragariae TaxID=53985 RepID=A0A6A3SG25_9STRA|nr:hypothetical protein PF007_g10223 [Phytophthora fragariae]
MYTWTRCVVVYWTVLWPKLAHSVYGTVMLQPLCAAQPVERIHRRRDVHASKVGCSLSGVLRSTAAHAVCDMVLRVAGT